ncbi:AAA ATPase containing von Willebrand factor type A (vWA) domain [Ceraceosorus bombacis]|uniref:Midasin n=1 Tax=Ceraceosorus bombacis TaxID=401625 RepID=A0A0P1BAN9_9BASI|nr:AAA ATPase containing von Willebrand factor type A (vWA) domain [Ceraceosorus bombacis]
MRDLAELLLEPAYTLLLATCFEALLPEIISTCLDEALQSHPPSSSHAHLTSPSAHPHTQRLRSAFTAIAALLPPFAQCFPAALRMLCHPAFSDGPLAHLSASASASAPAQSLSSIDEAKLHVDADERLEDGSALQTMLLSWYRLLHAAPALSSYSPTSWPTQQLERIITHPIPDAYSKTTRLIAIQALSAQQGIAESTRVEMEARYVGRPATGRLPLEEKQKEEKEGAVDAWIEVRSLNSSVVNAERVDAWNLALEELRRCDRVRHAQEQSKSHGGGGGSMRITRADLGAYTTIIGGTLVFKIVPLQHFAQGLPAAVKPPAQRSRFIETGALQKPLTDLVRLLALRRPILLSGPPACGKTSLLEHVCARMRSSESPTSSNLPILSLHLGDQSGLDAKALLGSFVSSPTRPGTFEWSEGALTRAVRLGLWVVLEDIDRASGEILSLIKPLAQALGSANTPGGRPQLDLGCRGKVQAGHGFALFATRNVHASRANASTLDDADALPPSPVFMGHGHWNNVDVLSPSLDDVQEILRRMFPRLAEAQDGALSRMVSVWSSAAALSSRLAKSSSGARTNGTRSGSRRNVSVRDLVKWAGRVEAMLSSAGGRAATNPFANQAMQEEIFAEACDVFLGALIPPASALLTAPAGANAVRKLSASNEAYAELLESLATGLGLSTETACFAIQGRTPELLLRSSQSGARRPGEAQQGTHVRIGRVELNRAPRGTYQTAVGPPANSFAMTRPALLLLERLAACVSQAEPVLMVGETGTGKTTIVQHLACMLGRPLTALNLSQQTESSDLLGAFKPLDAKLPATELHNAWLELFEKTFSARRNARFVDAERKAFAQARWSRLAALWNESAKMAATRRRKEEQQGSSGETPSRSSPGATSRKKRRTDDGPATARDEALDMAWQEFAEKARQFEIHHAAKKRNFVFSFVEGPLVRALRTGAWVLLDEVNLAAPETIDCLSALLQSSSSSLVLTERGDLEPVPRHPDFRIFACMNPATDVGKRDLPGSLRSRFTELYVPSPAADREALTSIVDKYVGHLAHGDRSAIMDVAETYWELRTLADDHELADGANQRPHYSIRTLSRALTFAADVSATYGLRRALWEGFTMAFVLLLDGKSAKIACDILQRRILSRAKNAHAAASFVPAAPDSNTCVQVGSFWLERGPLELDAAEDYVLTPSVQEKLVGLARAVVTRRNPVLIQGPTSAGKTSAVEYLARRTGHRFVRINNHEHTDLQEYIGSYASDADSARLVFHEGLLVRALRNGDWIVLDELNLAPTDVLEALNRLLDDNRELVIPETGEVVRPHPHFMLFATQNPPGLYAGRKVLSRAFRNRFLEIHFDDVPQAELEVILTHRCSIAPSYANKIVAVFVELQKRRQAGRVFDTKQAFVTLRDLFRWGQREAVGYQELAHNGYMLIAERARRADDKVTVRQVVEQVMRVKIDEKALYDLKGPASARLGDGIAERLRLEASRAGIVWTEAMQRMLCLVAAALQYDEPVLLVGETGAGKTSVCEVLAAAMGRELHQVNCHQNTDAADLLGGQRPLRNRAAQQAHARAVALEALALVHDPLADVSSEADLEDLAAALAKNASASTEPLLTTALQAVHRAMALFEWQDGPLVQAMRHGSHLLLDEISLADDSVLERLNSVLESGRTLVLAERTGAQLDKTAEGALDSAHLRAASGFQVVATMNPGGDYGKKELSPALRNRFTEIWVPHVEDRRDLMRILDAKWNRPELQRWGAPMLDFTQWFIAEVGGRDQANLGVRDLLAWTTFINQTAQVVLEEQKAFVQGAMMVIVDGVGSLPATAAMTPAGVRALRTRCVAQLHDVVRSVSNSTMDMGEEDLLTVRRTSTHFSIGPFSARRKDALSDREVSGANDFSFEARTTASNAMRVLRALCVPRKAILLEGSPGAGKTSLIAALARASGNALTRINLSDQTELTDLFGGDLPLEGGAAGQFEWRDAAFLRAMQAGDWVLLDEMNLASQTVLEGLNSCLDHRGTVYVPELGRTFTKHEDFRLFAAQNPHHQGGGRKGLPKSFLNRFTKVHVDELEAADILTICAHLYPAFHQRDLRRMIEFNARLYDATMVTRSMGRAGAPWEFNLRDLLRWLSLLHSDLGLNWRRSPVQHLPALFLQRFRNKRDRRAAAAIYQQVWGEEIDVDHRPQPTVTPRFLQVGHAVLPRLPRQAEDHAKLAFPQHILPAMETLIDCVHLGWLAILTGPSGAGKTCAVKLLAQLAGTRLEELCMSSGIDAMDVLGTFEQADPLVKLRGDLTRLDHALQALESSQLAALPDHDQLDAARHRVAQLLSSGSAMTDDQQTQLIASIEPLALVDETFAVREALEGVGKAAKAAASQAGRFEWHDGPLVRAMKRGDWLLIDDANLCSASVLDRLNSLFEQGGSLILSERGVIDGEIQVVRAHPSFRVFMALDPQHGELSRAMRNRGIEVYVPAPDASTPDHLAKHLSTLLPQSSASALALARFRIDERSNELQREAACVHIVQALPAHLLTLAMRVSSSTATEVDAAVIEYLRTHAIQHHALARSTIFAQTNALDLAVLSSFGPDLRANAATASGTADQDMFGQAIALLVQTTVELSKLKSTAQASLSKTEDALTALEWSALRFGGRSFERKAEPPVIFALAVLVPQIAQQIVPTSDASSCHAVAQLVDIASYLGSLSSQSPNFDYSSAHVLIKLMFQAAAQLAQNDAHAQQASRIVGVLHQLDSNVKLVTGLAMREIWAMCLGHGQDDVEAASAAANVIRLLHLVPRQALPPDLARTSIDVAATLTSPDKAWQANQRAELLDIASRLSAQLQAASLVAPQHLEQHARPHEHVARALAACETGLKHCARAAGLDDFAHGRKCLDAFMKAACNDSSYDLTSLVSLRRDAWGTRVAAGLHPAISPAQSSGDLAWAAKLWDLDAAFSPADLLRPLRLQSAVKIGSPRSVSLAELAAHKREAARVAELFNLELSLRAPPRAARLHAALQRLVRELTDALIPLLASEASAQLRDFAHRFVRDEVITLDDLEALVAHLDSTNPATRLPVLNIWLEMVEYLLRVGSTDHADGLMRLGLAWINVSCGMLSLFHPNVAVDPLVTERTQGGLSAWQGARLQAQIDVAARAEAVLTGNSSSPLTRSLMAKHAALMLEQPGAADRALERKPDLSKLTSLHREVSTFVQTVYQRGLLAQLATEQHRDSLPTDFEAREQDLQVTLGAFRQRLSAVHGSSMEDLVAPILVVLDGTRLGLRVLAQAVKVQGQTESSKRHCELLSALTSFPTMRATQLYAKVQLPVRLKEQGRASALSASLLLTAVACISEDVSKGVSLQSILQRLVVVYDQIYQLWVLDRDRERRAQEQEATLYKSRNLDNLIQDEAAAEEAEFLELFPEFEDVMETGYDSRTPQPTSANVSTTSFSKDHINSLYHLHSAIFGTSSPQISVRASALLQSLRQDVLQRALLASRETLPEALDQISAPLSVHMVTQSALTPDSSTLPAPDFYTAANLPQTSKAVAIVERLRERLTALITEWPEQMVLQHIRERCEAILRLDSGLPVARILAALEQLLVHTEDWEGYASSATSLKISRDEIIGQIIEWRRLELECWSSLLDTQAERFAAPTADFWFQLFEVAVRGMQAATMEGTEQAQDHLQKLIALLDQYVRSSSFGTFGPRLELLHSFSTFLDALVGGSLPQEEWLGLDKVATVLQNVNNFYGQLKPKVEETLHRQRDAIEKEIRDFVKLASWKDVNIHALKQSAQKTHRKLHRCIRKFRDVLRQPVDPLLATAAQSSASVVADEKGLLPAGGGSSLPLGQAEVEKILTRSSLPARASDTPPHLVDLSRTASKLAAFSANQLAEALESGLPTAMDELSGTIISRSAELAKLTPAVATEQNAKTIRALTSRKRKALSDLMRELRRVGLRSAVRPELVARHKDVTYLYVQRGVTESENPHVQRALAGADRYHYRLLAALPHLRESVSSRTDDVPVADLLKGINFVEHASSLTFASRAELATLTRQANAARGISTRLQYLATSDGPATACKPGIVPALAALVDFLARAVEGLGEAISNTPVYLHFSPLEDSRIALSFLWDSVKGEVSRLSATRTSLLSLLATLRMSSCLFLLQHEAKLLGAGTEALDAIVRELEVIGRRHPDLSAMTQPLGEWISQEADDVFAGCRSALQGAADPANREPASDRLVSSVLVIAQELHKLGQQHSSDVVDDEMADQALARRIEHTARISQTLRFEQVQDSLMELFASAVFEPASNMDGSLARVTPFVAEYAGLIERHLATSAACYRNLVKLTLVLCNTFTSLSLKGFCKPAQADDNQAEADGEGGEQVEGGTGLGDGSGAKDVTDQMQDDEEMEELQGEKAEEEDGEKGETQREKNAREMEEDFGGELESVADQGEDEQGQDDQDEADDEDLDEQRGGVDPLDPNTVDEKMWGEENGNEGEEAEHNQDQTDKDLDGPQQGPEESVAKDRSKQKQDSAADNKPESSQDEDGAGNEQDAAEDVSDLDEDQKDDGDSANAEADAPEMEQGMGRQLDEQTAEADNLDFQDELELDERADDGSELSFDEDEDPQQPPDESNANDAATELEPDRTQDPADADHPESADAGQDAMDIAGDNEDGGEANSSEEDEDADDAEVAENLGAERAAPENQHSQPQDAAVQSAMDEDAPADGGDADEGASAEQQNASRSRSGRQAQDGEEAEPQDGDVTRNQDGEADTARSEAKPEDAQQNVKQSRRETQDAQEGAKEQVDEANGESESGKPERSLGDALQDFRRDIQAIEEAMAADERATDQARPDGEGMPETGEVEHIGPDEETDLQALGAAGEDDEVQRLPDTGIADEEQGVTDTSVQQWEDSVKPADRDLAPQPLGEAPMQMDTEDAGPSQEKQAKALDASQTRSNGHLEPGADAMNELEDGALAAANDRGDDESDRASPMPEDERRQADADIEADLLALRSASDDHDKLERAGELWRAYIALTSDLAFGLCEQLRLILAPTLATRLNGDFRTGKRLNMRKIVPFIASDFAKDKIWLRRTKPSAREYQVLLAVDDSRSMSENRSAHLAYQTLALVSSALGRLEVGDVSICRFGQQVETLHPFGKDKLSDSGGAQLVERLSFEQRSTDVLKLVEHSLRMLQEARDSRTSTSASDLWQLEIIISDGICQDHERLRALLRRASEQRVMLVFIILDARPKAPTSTPLGPAQTNGDNKQPSTSTSTSIVDMSSVSYSTNPESGKMELVMKRYLDTFPFEYFVVVRDLEALPDVLAATLRQWAERISGEA